MPRPRSVLIALPTDWQSALDRIAKRRGAAIPPGSPLPRSAAVRELIANDLPANERKKLSVPRGRGEKIAKPTNKKPETETGESK